MPRWMLRTQVILGVLVLLMLTLAPQVEQRVSRNSNNGGSTQVMFDPPPDGVNPNGDSYGGYPAIAIPNTSGYFRTAQYGGRWWLVTPDGHPFFSIGINTAANSQQQGAKGSYSYYTSQIYGSTENWAAATAARLRGWGFNTVGSFSDPSLAGRGLVSTKLLDLSLSFDIPVANLNFRDVFDPGFTAFVNNAVQQRITDADISNPWLMGYFLDNEIWWYKGGAYVAKADNTVVEDFIALPASAAGKQAWVGLLRERYGTIEALNGAWGSGYTSFDGEEGSSLANTAQINNPAAAGDKNEFLRRVADRYYSITTSAIRARDPNHLILSDRALPPPQLRAVVEAARPYVDAYSVNVYNRNFNYSAPDLTSADQAAAWGGKPVLVTEYTARAADSGLPNNFVQPGPVLPTQDARGDAYRIGVNEMLKRPYIVGVHWFAYADDWMAFKEDNPDFVPDLNQGNNWGLVTANDQPYTGLVNRMAEYHGHIYEYLTGGNTGLIPTVRFPRSNDKVFDTRPRFEWEKVAGAQGYVLQIARRPDFAGAATYTASNNWFYPPRPLDYGRWYWRIRTFSDRPADLDYTTATPFYLYRVTNTAMVSDFESAADVAGWRSDPGGAVSFAGVGGGATEGKQASQFGYTGAADYNTLWASAFKLPEGADFQPRNWTQYDFLALDVTNPSLNFPYAYVHSAIIDDGFTKGYDWQSLVYPGTDHITNALAPAGRNLDLSQVGHYLFGYRLPEAGRVLYMDNIRLLRVDRATAPQAAINAVAAPSNIPGTVEVDWVGYQPAASTVGYRIYVSTQPFASVEGMTPVTQLDATAMHTRVKLSASVTSGRPRPLMADTPYYFAVVPVDVWGNLGPVGPMTMATPSGL